MQKFDWNEFWELIFGGISLPTYLAALIFSLLAIVLSLWLGSANRNADSSSTPEKFSWKFLLMDNTKRVGVGLIAMFLFYRFASAAIGRALSMEVAVGIGFFISMGLDQAIGWLKKRFPLLQENREKIVEKLQK